MFIKSLIHILANVGRRFILDIVPTLEEPWDDSIETFLARGTYRGVVAMPMNELANSDECVLR